MLRSLNARNSFAQFNTPSSRRLAAVSYFTAASLLVLLVLNRAGAKFGIGPVFLLDLVLLVNALAIAKLSVRNAQLFFSSAVAIALAVVWLSLEFASGQFEPNNLRRFAMSIYLLVPMLILARGATLYRIIWLYPLPISLLVAIAASGGLWVELRPTVSAQVLAFLLLLCLTRYGKGMVKLSIVAAAYIYVVSGYSSDHSAFRTPIVGLVGALAVAGLVTSLYGAGRMRRFARKGLVASSLVLAVSFPLVAHLPVVHQLVAGVYGLIGVRAPDSIELDRDRGDSSGTVETRTQFWASIVQNSAKSWMTLAFGNGHFKSFFERTKPYAGFDDEEVLEPHNSFMGMFDRYGIVGVAALLALLWTTAIRRASNDRHRAFAVAAYVLAFNYCFFEVVLESPHGAVIFWIIWLAPICLTPFFERRG